MTYKLKLVLLKLKKKNLDVRIFEFSILPLVEEDLRYLSKYMFDWMNGFCLSGFKKSNGRSLIKFSIIHLSIIQLTNSSFYCWQIHHSISNMAMPMPINLLH